MAEPNRQLKSAPRGGKYDPVKRAAQMAAVVCREELRRYYRFRPARFYGGIATADCVGCCLRCIFCWSWREVTRPGACGRFYEPGEVAAKLLRIARSKRFTLLRISGNEPTIGREHLLEVLDLIPRDIDFILETNGILLGHDKSYAEELARFDNLYVRVGLKGTNEKEFSALTGAEPAGFALQLQALENLAAAKVRAHPAAMVSFSPPENIQALRERLGRIAPSFADLEIEELALYGGVESRLRQAGFQYRTSYQPRNTPADQV